MKAWIAWIAGLATLVGASSARAQCVIEPGVYGGVANQLSQVKKPGVVEATWRFTAAVELTTSCEGKATVKFTNTSIQLQVASILPPASGTCKLTVADGTADAVVETGAGNLPRIKFQMPQTITFHDCQGLALIWYDFLNFAGMPGVETTSYEFQATEREAPAPVYRGKTPFVLHGSLAGLETRLKDWGGTWTIEYLWVLMRGAAGEGPPPQTDEPKTPVLGQIQGRFERIFLAGIGPVPNIYSVPINWGGEAPGTVTFRLDGQVIPSALTPAGASAEVRVDQLAVGAHVLSVTAVSTKGKQAARQRPIHIVEVPPWLAEFNLTTQLLATAVRYRGAKNIALPAFTKVVTELDPYLKTTWRFAETSLGVQLFVQSNQDITVSPPIVGGVNFQVGESPLNLPILGFPAPVVRVRLTETALLLVDGGFALGEANEVRLRRVGQIFPFFMANNDPQRGVVESTVVPARINVTSIGRLNFGIIDDKFRISDGTLELRVQLRITNPPFTANVANGPLFVAGTADGMLRVQYDPDPAVIQCQFGSLYSGDYTIAPTAESPVPAKRQGAFAPSQVPSTICK